jgi:hypothetical protein
LGAVLDLTTPAANDRPVLPRHRRGRLGDRWTVMLALPVVIAELALLATIWQPARWTPSLLVVTLGAFLVLGGIAAVRVGRVYASSTAKHAQHASVTIARDSASVRLTLADNGAGMAPGAMKASGHFRLLTARRRAAAAGGTMRVSSGAGTRIVVDCRPRRER